jgi:hypothetical protein
MKRLIGAIVITALLLAGICFGVLFAAKSKSKILLAEYLRGIDNWSVESAYFNPFTHSLKIKGFTVALASGIEFSIKSMLLSDFKQSEDMITCSASLEEILFLINPVETDFPDPSEDIETNEDSFSNPPKNIKIAADSFSAFVRLDKERLDKFIEIPSTKFNPLKSFDNLELNNAAFSINEHNLVSLENLTGDGYRLEAMFRLSAGEDKKIMNFNFLGFSFYPADSVSKFNNLVIQAEEEIRIEKITAATTYKDGVYTKKINIDSSDLFLLDLSCNIAPIDDYISPETPAGALDFLDAVMLYDFEMDYTDRSFTNMVLDRYAASKNIQHDVIIDYIETFAAYYSDWEAVLNSFAAFLREPKTVKIKAKPVNPASVYHFIHNIYELGLNLSFNGGDGILVQNPK